MALASRLVEHVHDSSMDENPDSGTNDTEDFSDDELNSVPDSSDEDYTDDINTTPDSDPEEFDVAGASNTTVDATSSSDEVVATVGNGAATTEEEEDSDSDEVGGNNVNNAVMYGRNRGNVVTNASVKSDPSGIARTGAQIQQKNRAVPQGDSVGISIQDRQRLITPFSSVVSRNLDGNGSPSIGSDGRVGPATTISVSSSTSSSDHQVPSLFTTMLGNYVPHREREDDDRARVSMGQSRLYSHGARDSTSSPLSPNATLVDHTDQPAPVQSTFNAGAGQYAGGVPASNDDASRPSTNAGDMASNNTVTTGATATGYSIATGGYDTYVRREYREAEALPDLSQELRNSFSNNPHVSGNVVPERPVHRPRRYSASHCDLFLTTRSKTAGNSGYDPRRFKTETYFDTGIHFASDDRDAEFHDLFIDVLDDDHLLDDFECSLNRGFLYQGRVYISTYCICFRSNILGGGSQLVIPIKNISFLHKTFSAGLFPNAISMEVGNETIKFTNFNSRDLSFELIKEVWTKNIQELLDFDDSDLSFSSSSSDDDDDDDYYDMRGSIDKVSREIAALNESARRTLGRMSRRRQHRSRRNSSARGTRSRMNTYKIYKFRRTSRYRRFDFGPFLLSVNNVQTEEPEDYHEFVLTETELNCTPNQAFQIMFNSRCYRFVDRLLLSLDGNRIRIPGPHFKEIVSGLLTRKYQYERFLRDIPGNPRSTRCIVTEEIVKADPAESIEVVSTVQTPDVPSGRSFETKTRYIFKWGPSNNCIITVSYLVNWTGTSWIKRQVEERCRSGKLRETERALRILREMIREEVVCENNVADDRMLRKLERAGGPVVFEEPLEEDEREALLSGVAREISIAFAEKPRTGFWGAYREGTTLLLALITFLLLMEWRARRDLMREMAELRRALYQVAHDV